MNELLSVGFTLFGYAYTIVVEGLSLATIHGA
jgi:hypothetical protein